MDKDKQLIHQSNVLTESRYDFNRTEKNAIYCIIREVRRTYVDEEHQGETTFQNLNVFMSANALDNITDAKDRKRTQESLINLRKRDITIENEDGFWLNVGFINWAKFHAERNVYEVEVSSQIMPYLVQLASKYTSYDLTVAIALKSKWTQRFYELCCQYKNLNDSAFHKTITQLRKMFMLEDKYPKLPDLKNKVIDIAQKELKELYDKGECNVYFEYRQEGRGDKAMFHFFITSREKEAEQKKRRADMTHMVNHISATLLKLFPKDKKYFMRIAKDIVNDEKKILEVYNKICRIEKKYPRNEQAPILRYALGEDLGIK